MTILSPITGRSNTTILKKIHKEYFIDLYKNTLNIDVSNYFNEIEDVFLVKCNESDLIFFYPPSIAGDSIFYEKLQKFDWYYMVDKWEFKEAAKYIQDADFLLEIGSGNGAFLEFLKKDKNKIEVIEYNKQSINHLINKGYHVHNKTIQDICTDRKEYYDIVINFQVLEHVNNVDEFLSMCVKVLKPGGKLIISVPNNKSLILKLDSNVLNLPPHHMGLWDKSIFKKVEKFYPITLDKIIYEPLLPNQYKRFYWVVISFLRKRIGIVGNILDKMLYPFSEKIISSISPVLRGQSMIVTFKKNEK